MQSSIKQDSVGLPPIIESMLCTFCWAFFPAQDLSRSILCVRLKLPARVLTSALLAFQSSPGRFPRTKQGRVTSLPGKEPDNTHSSYFHMVLFLTL